jgi:hypothetical protein
MHSVDSRLPLPAFDHRQVPFSNETLDYSLHCPFRLRTLHSQRSLRGVARTLIVRIVCQCQQGQLRSGLHGQGKNNVHQFYRHDHTCECLRCERRTWTSLWFQYLADVIACPQYSGCVVLPRQYLADSTTSLRLARSSFSCFCRAFLLSVILRSFSSMRTYRGPRLQSEKPHQRPIGHNRELKLG